MKKLMVLAAAAALAFSVKASVANWVIDLDTTAYDGTYTWLVAVGTDASTLAGYLTDGKISDFNTAVAGLANKESAPFVEGDWGYAGSGVSGVSDADTIFSIIYKNDLAADSTFLYAEESLAGHTYEAGGKPVPGVAWESDAFSSGTIGTGGGDTPEPTSGLLLLLGVAGLALRRKQA